MKKYLAIILTLISFQSKALIGEGEAKINMIQPLTLTQKKSVDFGNVSIDGAGIIYISPKDKKISCSNFVSSSCPASGEIGEFEISGRKKTSVFLSVSQNGILAHANGATLTFIPELKDYTITLKNHGEGKVKVGGTISLLGNEDSGEFLTSNSGGIPYQINVIY